MLKPESEPYASASLALAADRLDAAEALLDDRLANNPDDWIALDLMGDVATARGDLRQAADHRARAVCANPADTALQKKFLKTAGGLKIRTYDGDLEAAVTHCLANPAIESLAGADPLWMWTLRQRPGFDALFQKVSKPRLLTPRRNPFYRADNLGPLLDPYFQQGVRKILICWLQFEAFLTLLRAFLLEEFFATAPRLPTKDRLELAVTVAIYCFRTDYIFNRSTGEQTLLKRLQEAIAAGNTDPLALALLACYQPLYSLSTSAANQQRLKSEPALQPLDHQQVMAYAALQEESARIVRLFPIKDDTSLKVQSQYEDFPYPRWKHLDDFSSAILPAETHHLAKGGQSILVAGCGTGLQPCLLARQFPDSAILAIDLTAASLAYAQTQAHAHGFANITFRQADILDLDALAQEFDYISCFGVLHHMADPERGWQKLVARLKPAGLMEIGLYSRLGRRTITAGRNLIARRHIPATPDGMRQFRRQSRWYFTRRDYTTLTNWYDYYALNMYRDLLFHAHEDQFDIPRIQSALTKLGLVFAGFKLPAATHEQYRLRYPGDPEGTNLTNWHAFETANPDSFGECYRFLCRKA